MGNVHYGFTSGCTWAYFNNGWKDDEWQGYIQYLDARLSKLSKEPCPTALTILQKAKLPSRAQRVMMMDLLNKHKVQAHRLLGHAVVTDSWTDRMAIRALNLVVKKPCPERVFSSAIAAVIWLGKLSPSLQLTLLWKALSVAAPDDSAVAVAAEDDRVVPNKWSSP